MSGSRTLILGGVRSGKSRLAEKLARESALPVSYIATAREQGGDGEMSDRIAKHRARRPGDWQLIEEPLRLGTAISRCDAEWNCTLVDCLTLWLTNLLLADDASLFDRERRALLDSITDAKGKIILVSNETNMGIVPLGELSRRYCDEAGRLHQDVAECSENVVLTVAGLPHCLKGKLDD